jgi:putative SOS response-associated peptidase YedK
MCGRITQKDGELPGFTTITLVEELFPPRHNGAPSQEFWIIRRNHETGDYQRDRMKWGLVPYWADPATLRDKPINARAEGIRDRAMFKAAYARRRCLVPIDNFFEWRAIKGQKAKQPYAIAMKDGSPFAVAGIWESWTDKQTGEILRSFAIITTEANELMAQIHDRMPVIIAPVDYERWLSTLDPDPRDLLAPYPAEPLAIWPISGKVNSPRNDTPDILDPAEPVPEEQRRDLD